jgi:hypothetical protein
LGPFQTVIRPRDPCVVNIDLSKPLIRPLTGTNRVYVAYLIYHEERPSCRDCDGMADYDGGMCRNITELRGLQPPATDDEVEAAARQFVRKVSGLQKPPAGVEEAYERAVANVTAEVHALLDALPARRQPPSTVPPLRRPEVRARIAAREKARA